MAEMPDMNSGDFDQWAEDKWLELFNDITRRSIERCTAQGGWMSNLDLRRVIIDACLDQYPNMPFEVIQSVYDTWERGLRKTAEEQGGRGFIDLDDLPGRLKPRLN